MLRRGKDPRHGGHATLGVLEVCAIAELLQRLAVLESHLRIREHLLLKDGTLDLARLLTFIRKNHHEARNGA
mgnify:CR=1 FL=1